MRKHLKWMIPVAVAIVVAVVFVIKGQRGGGNAAAEPGGRERGGPPGRQDRHLRDRRDQRPPDRGRRDPAGDDGAWSSRRSAGRSYSLHVEEGETVRRGALLAKVEPDMAQARTVASLKSGYGRARVDLDRARQDYERDIELHEAGHISDEELRLSKDSYDIANDRVPVRLRADASSPRRTECRWTSRPSRRSSWTSSPPPRARSSASSIEEGEIVTSGAVSYTSGTTLMTIADLSKMQIKAGVNEVDVGKITFRPGRHHRRRRLPATSRTTDSSLTSPPPRATSRASRSSTSRSTSSTPTSA